MKDVQKILGQVPELVRKQGTAREKLETIWRLMAVSRQMVCKHVWLVI